RLNGRSGIAFRQPDDAGEFAIEIDFQRGVLELLLDAGIRNARDVADLRKQLVRERAAGVEVGAGDLNIEGRRRAKIEDLGDDVSGKERESCAGKSRRQLLAQSLHIDVRGGLAFIQADRYVGIEDADRAGTSIRNIDAAVRKTNIVE